MKSILKLNSFLKFIIALEFIIFTTAIISKLYSWYIVEITLICIGLALGIWILNMCLPVVRGIKVILPDSFIGFKEALSGDQSQHHQYLLKVAKEYGKLAQFYIMGYPCVLINDKVMAKEALMQVIGKGELMVSHIKL